MNTLDYDFSAYQKAFKGVMKTFLQESTEEFDAQAVSDEIDESQVTYNKIQKILNTPEMIKSHAYLYALDMENVDECDKQKIDKLYELGKARGVISEDDEKQEKEQEENVDECDDALCGGPDDALTHQNDAFSLEPQANKSSSQYTILYSAMKDGLVKTGTFFSSAVDEESAKEDCLSNLSPLGYTNIRVIGIEKTNPSEYTPSIYDDTVSELSEDDSKEYEEQETGSGDTEEKSEEKQDNAGNSSEPDKPEEKPEDNQEENPEETSEEPKEEPNKDSENEETSTEEPEEKKLTSSEKQTLRDEYVGIFKSELQKMGVEKSVEEMTIKEKAKFWKIMSEKWTKQEPEDFMSKSEIEKLYSTVLKK